MTERQYLTLVCGFTNFGPIRTKLLLSYFKSAKNIWDSHLKDILKTGIRRQTALNFIEYRKNFDIPKYFKTLKKLGIQVLAISDGKYPKNLKPLEDSPPVLYVKGNLKKLDSNAVAIVGTRMMTSYGRDIARKFASELVGHGITIVSGLALGVDAEAQGAAINAGGRTIAVLASGLDIISPLANKPLAVEFLKRGSGAIVSEYMIGHVPQPFDFPIRDRLISGLSKGVIVIEGTRKSGTFYTVKAALDQGRSVFAVPGPITSPTSEAPNYLIQNGAKLVTSIKDVLEELDLGGGVNTS